MSGPDGRQKRKSDTSIKDILSDIQGKSEVENGLEKEARLDNFDFNEEFQTKIQDYNKRLADLDEMYSTVRPINKILIKMRLNELKRTEEGTLIPSVELYMPKTQAGYGNMQAIENPFPFSREAIVIAIPYYKDEKGVQTEYMGVKVGDRIVLRGKPIALEGGGDQARIAIPNAFIHPDYEKVMYPTDPDNRHYGYILVDPYADVQVVLP